jgi:hypothetical protein
MKQHDAEAKLGRDFPLFAAPGSRSAAEPEFCPVVISSQRLARQAVEATLVHGRKSL